jgi:hypothetical protein
MLFRVLLLAFAALLFATSAHGQARGAVDTSSAGRTQLWVPPQADRARLILPARSAERQLIPVRRPIGFQPNRTAATPLGRAPIRAITPPRVAVIQASQARDAARGRVHQTNDALMRAVERPAGNAGEQAEAAREIVQRANEATEAGRALSVASQTESEARQRLEMAERPARGPLGFGATQPPSTDDAPRRRGPIGFVTPQTNNERVGPSRRGPIGFVPSRQTGADPRSRLLPRRAPGFIERTSPLASGRELEARLTTVSRAEARLRDANTQLERSTTRVIQARAERQRLVTTRPANGREHQANILRITAADRRVTAAEEQHRAVREEVRDATAALENAREALGDPPSSQNAPIGFGR